MNHPLKNEIADLKAHYRISENIDSLYEICLKFAVNYYQQNGKVTKELEEVLDAIQPYIPEEDEHLVHKMYKEMGK